MLKQINLRDISEVSSFTPFLDFKVLLDHQHDELVHEMNAVNRLF